MEGISQEERKQKEQKQPSSKRRNSDNNQNKVVLKALILPPIFINFITSLSKINSKQHLLQLMLQNK